MRPPPHPGSGNSKRVQALTCHPPAVPRMPGGGRGTRLLALALLLGAFVPRPLRRSGAEAHLHRDHDPEQRYARRRLLGVGGGGGGERAERFEHNDPTPETPHLPRHEREWHAPIGLKSSTRPRSLHGPGAPEGVRQRALLEQVYGRAKIQRYLERKGDIRLLDAGRERLRRAIAVAEHFASLRVIAQETQLLHVLAEAIYALDSRHMRVGRERVYHAHDLFEALEPRQPQLMRLDGAWTDLGDSCVVGADCGRYSECVRRRCQPPRFPRPMRVFTEQIQQQLKRRVMQHIGDNGMDKHDHAARFWGGSGAVLNATDESIAAHVRLHMHAGAADPLLGQDAAVVREMLATAIGGPVEPAHIDGLRTQPAQGSLEFDVHGGAGVAATNESARAGGLAGLGRASLAGFDPTDIEFQRPIAGACSRLELHHECCQGRDNRTGRLNGLRVRDEPCQIVMRQSGEWECQPTMWVTYHLRKAMHEDVVVVGCNATEDVPHITRHVGHRRRRLQQKKQKEAHHPVRYRVAHNYAIEDDRVPGGHTGEGKQPSLAFPSCSLAAEGLCLFLSMALTVLTAHNMQARHTRRACRTGTAGTRGTRRARLAIVTSTASATPATPWGSRGW